MNKGDRVCRNKLSITGVEKFIRKIKLIRITDLLFEGRVERLNKTNIRRKGMLTRKIMVDLVTTEPTSKRRSDCIKDSRKTSSEGRRSSEIGHMSKLSNGSTKWRESSMVCIG